MDTIGKIRTALLAAAEPSGPNAVTTLLTISRAVEELDRRPKPTAADIHVGIRAESRSSGAPYDVVGVATFCDGNEPRPAMVVYRSLADDLFARSLPNFMERFIVDPPRNDAVSNPNVFGGPAPRWAFVEYSTGEVVGSARTVQIEIAVETAEALLTAFTDIAMCDVLEAPLRMRRIPWHTVRRVLIQKADTTSVEVWPTHASGQHCAPVEVVAGLLEVSAADLGLDGNEPYYLVGLRAGDRAHVGCWEFPGGKVEPGESAELALVREWHEELGLTVRLRAVDEGHPVAEYTGDSAGTPFHLRLFRIEAMRDQAFLDYCVSTRRIFGSSATRAHSEMRWMTLLQLAQIHPDFLTPSMPSLVQDLRDADPLSKLPPAGFARAYVDVAVRAGMPRDWALMRALQLIAGSVSPDRGPRFAYIELNNIGSRLGSTGSVGACDLEIDDATADAMLAGADPFVALRLDLRAPGILRGRVVKISVETHDPGDTKTTTAIQVWPRQFVLRVLDTHGIPFYYKGEDRGTFAASSAKVYASESAASAEERTGYAVVPRAPELARAAREEREGSAWPDAAAFGQGLREGLRDGHPAVPAAPAAPAQPTAQSPNAIRSLRELVGFLRVGLPLTPGRTIDDVLDDAERVLVDSHRWREMAKPLPTFSEAARLDEADRRRHEEREASAVKAIDRLSEIVIAGNYDENDADLVWARAVRDELSGHGGPAEASVSGSRPGAPLNLVAVKRLGFLRGIRQAEMYLRDYAAVSVDGDARLAILACAQSVGEMASAETSPNAAESPAGFEIPDSYFELEPSSGLADAVNDVRDFMERGQPEQLSAELCAPELGAYSALVKDLAANCVKYGPNSRYVVRGAPPMPPDVLALSLIMEEVGEAAQAMLDGKVEDFADGLADLIYVTIGAGLRCGIPLAEVWAEVHAANMRKFNCDRCMGTGQDLADPEPGAAGCIDCDGSGYHVYRDAAGKVIKPPDWAPPDIKGALGILPPWVESDEIPEPMRFVACSPRRHLQRCVRGTWQLILDDNGRNAAPRIGHTCDLYTGNHPDVPCAGLDEALVEADRMARDVAPR